MAISKDVSITDIQRPKVAPELIVQDSTTNLVDAKETILIIKDSLVTVQDSLVTVKQNSKTLIEFKEKVMGGLAMSDYMAGFFFAFIGMFLRWWFTMRKGVRRSVDTPFKFNGWFWLFDNLKDKILVALGTIAVLFIFMRFPFDLLGYTFSMFFAFGVGLFLDYCVDLLEKMKPPRDTVQ